jgi:hypothetical protein
MFGEKITEGLAFSQEFIDIISVISPLSGIAYYMAPLIGVWDCFIGFALLFNMTITRNARWQSVIFVWCILWPFVPASLRYFSGVAEFEIYNVLSISISALVAYLLWRQWGVKE